MVTDYKEVLQMPDVDAVIICASWDMHVEMCIEAMKAGKYVGCEVGGAYSLRECWKLIETYEETKSACYVSGKLSVWQRRNDGIKHGRTGSAWRNCSL